MVLNSKGAKMLVKLISEVSAEGRALSFDFNAPREELKQQERTSGKPLRGEGNTDSTYPVLDAAAAARFRAHVAKVLGERIRASFPSLQD